MSNYKRKVYVVGHKNPDTDSICTAIAYANLKTKLTQIRHEPRRAGQLNEETQYVLERFGVKVPLLLSDLREQIKDVDLRESEEINGNLSIRTAWEKMTEMNTHTQYIVRKRIPGYVLGFSDHNSGRIYASHYKNLRKQQL